MPPAGSQLRLVDVPPRATVFRSDGGLYYLHLGALELAALQREWGVARPRPIMLEGETPEQMDERIGAEWTKIREDFNRRLDGSVWADMITVFRVSMSRWAKHVGAEPLDDDAVALIVDGAEDINDKFKQSAGRAGDLWIRFHLEMLGPPIIRPAEDEEENDERPKVKGASTPNGSSPKASGGGSRSRKRGGSRPTSSDSTPPLAESGS